jgi:hypothetical protein
MNEKDGNSVRYDWSKEEGDVEVQNAKTESFNMMFILNL